MIRYSDSSTPRRRPAPKDGAAAKPAPTAEEIAEWQKPLEECIKEVKELVSRGVPLWLEHS
jgi:hypothetical protein